YQNSDICRLRATKTHGSKGFMTRCIKERDLLVVDIYHISADMLCDTTGFSLCDMRGTNGIQKRSLTVVNMTHDTDNQRTTHQGALIVLFLFQKFLNDIHFYLFLGNTVVFQSDLRGLIKGKLCVDRHHLAG